MKVAIASGVVLWLVFAFLIWAACAKGGMEDDMAGRPRG